VALTFVFFSVFPIALLVARTPRLLVAAFVLRGLKELGEPTRKSLILELCPADARATHFGGYYCLRDSLAAAAAALGAMIWAASPAATLIVASAFGLVGTLGYALAAARADPDRRPVPGPRRGRPVPAADVDGRIAGP
jgi:hypothetical protein